jgi:GDP-D-mannose dehydratase
LKGSPKKAIEKLNFKPKFSFLNLVNEMVEKDFVLAQNEFNKKY